VLIVVWLFFVEFEIINAVSLLHKGSFGTHHFISFGRNEMKCPDDIISF
jgi:hypothetical protein